MYHEAFLRVLSRFRLKTDAISLPLTLRNDFQLENGGQAIQRLDRQSLSFATHELRERRLIDSRFLAQSVVTDLRGFHRVADLIRQCFHPGTLSINWRSVNQ